MPESLPTPARPPLRVLRAVLAIACVPAGFWLPLLFGLKGLEVWPVAIGIWLAGVLLGAVKVPKAGALRGWQLFALWLNLVLVVLCAVGYFLAGSVSR